jgi:hypothetical protein
MRIAGTEEFDIRNIGCARPDRSHRDKQEPARPEAGAV